MREFVVSQAPLDRVATLARSTIEQLGGVVSHHTERTTEFDHLQLDEGDWSRSGYVGTYQRYQEEPVRLRIRVWASWPRKLFFWSIWLGLVEAVLFFALSLVEAPPPPNVWILSAIVTFALIGITLLMYATSWADSADLEDEIARHLTGDLREDETTAGEVYTLGEWEEHRAEVIETTVEEAKRKAPERPSRAKRALQTVTPSAGSGPGLVDRLRSREDDDEAPPAPDRTPETEEPPEAGEEPPAAEEPAEHAGDEPVTEEDGLLDRIAFWRSTDDQDETPEDEVAPEHEPAPAEDADAADEEDEGPGLVDRLAFWRSSEADEADDEESTAEAKRRRLEELKEKKRALADEQADDEPESG